MAVSDIDSLPSTANGISVTSTTAAWGTPSWTEVTTGVGRTIYLNGITFQPTLIPALDTTIEILIELGIGGAGSEVVEVQIPYSFRNDTQVGYYFQTSHTIFLPEPIEILPNTRITARAYDSHTAAVTYQGVKLWYREGAVAEELIVTPGSVIFTGVPVTLSKNINLNVTPGNITFTGEPVTLTKVANLNVTPGNITFTGASTTLTKNIDFNITPGNITFAGASVTLTKTMNLNITPGNITFTGASVSLESTAIVARRRQVFLGG